jgi:hypothetical protein
LRTDNKSTNNSLKNSNWSYRYYFKVYIEIKYFTLRSLLKNKAINLTLTWCFLLIYNTASSQDSTEEQSRSKIFFHNIFKQVKDAVTVAKKDSSASATVLNTKGETYFNSYHGKVIRHIITKELGFEKTFTDTSSKIKYFGSKVLNALHTDTKSWVIRSNLFFRENSVLNAYLMADNERYLRSLKFIQDARILVDSVSGSNDSVDVQIITKDLFTITGILDVNGIKRVRTRIAENNLMGMGQGLQYTALFDRSRRPFYGYELLYSKNSIANTLINGTIGYTLINTGRSNGTEEEKAFYIRLERPLVSPYSKLAGGLEVSYNHSENYYNKPDSQFYNYRYNLYDVWGGYNLGVTKLLKSNNKIRDRSFFALRYLRNNFVELPFQVGDKFDPLYNTRNAVLAELTLFRQDFYKTNYIYGFGTTEDIPYGFNIALTGGWYQQLFLKRAYAGINANYFIVTHRGEFMQYIVQTGGFRNHKWEDASVLLGANMFSKLYYYKNWKIREHIKFSYTQQFNRVTFEPLKIDNPYGLEYFSSDSLWGQRRATLYAETVVFLKRKVLGFQIAPFAFADLSLLTPEKAVLNKSDLYSGLGGGIRTRNENLIFGTIQLKMTYFPRRGDRNNVFKISVQSNLRFRYNSRYIKAPDIIQLNSVLDDNF